MYASDYRHWDSEFPDSVKEVKKIPGMTDDKLRHVLGENARKWFNLKDRRFAGAIRVFTTKARRTRRFGS